MFLEAFFRSRATVRAKIRDHFSGRRSLSQPRLVNTRRLLLTGDRSQNKIKTPKADGLPGFSLSCCQGNQFIEAKSKPKTTCL